MTRDRVIAISERIPSAVSIPIQLGALRNGDTDLSWSDEARRALADGERAVLSGDITHLDELVTTVSEILSERPHGRFALLIHAQQARHKPPPKNALSVFETIYVATAENVEPADIRQIEFWWHPTWVLVPTTEINRGDWIPHFLLPSRQGHLILLATKHSRIAPDELRLQLQDFSFEHPLIEIRPAPPEWYTPSELGPGRTGARDVRRAKLVQDSRGRDDYGLSIIVPFRWTGESAHAEMLGRTLNSIAEAFGSHERCEIIVAVDRAKSRDALTARDLGHDLSDTAFVDVERIDASSDWRAGFVRNCGTRFSRNRNGFYLFVDADVVIAPMAHLSRTVHDLVAGDSVDLVQITDFPDAPAFTTASSSFLFVRTSVFSQVGGFSDAFSQYGCEDNFFVWRASRMHARIHTLSTSTIEHLRPWTDDDNLVAKMQRLRSSSELMYRMTLDPAVHRHFFSALGSDLWLRAALKRAALNPMTRLLMAPFVFLLTLFETRDRVKYLASFVEISIWKLKRPVLWLRSNRWKTQLVKHAWRRNAWKVPNFFISAFGRAKIAIQKLAIALLASRFGWNFVAWRLRLWTKFTIDQIRWRASVSRIRFAGACLWLLTAIVSFFSNLSWFFRVGSQRSVGYLRRLVGQIRGSFRGPVERIKGETRRILTVHVLVSMTYVATRPRALWQMHGWRISKTILDLRAESWFFKEPSGWFAVRTPHFYKWVWRPIIKIWRFLEYQFSKRWGNS